MRQKLDLIGQRFGRLTVLSKIKNNKRYTQWLCLCDCGNTTIVEGQNLKRGCTISCGCFRKETISNLGKKNKKYNMGMKDVYKIIGIWRGIKQRCNSKREKDYRNYYNRGISVCDEWINDFENFYNWAINNGYKEGLSIDRIDVNGNYEPSNCRWVTMQKQQRNKRTNHCISFNGEIHCVSEWAEILGINVNTIFSRLQRNWSIEKALTTPTKQKVKHV